MNREIKFRAWDKDNKVIREVAMIEFDDTGRKEIVKLWDHPSVSMAKIKAQISIHHKEELDLMQYIGLKDKNGKEIYEGDIVSCQFFNALNIPVKKTLEVEFENGCFGVIEGSVFKSFDGATKKRIEVIGNIHEAPELTNPPKGNN